VPKVQPPVNSQRLLIGFLVVVLGLYVAWKSSQQPAAKPEPAPAKQQTPEAAQDSPSNEAAAEKPATETTAGQTESDNSAAVKAVAAPAAVKKFLTQIPNVTVRDQDDKVVFRGTVDVGPTLKRIEQGEKLRFSHDGIVFENREKRLPKKPSGYYHEYVHPTVKVGGPGPQRIVKGKGGEVFYTHDHYHTFLRLDQP
jgi:ribonuclease T1